MTWKHPVTLLRAGLGIIGLVIMFLGFDVAFGGIRTLGWMGTTNYLEIVGHGLPQALAGALFCGLTLLPFWFFGGIGGGDVKFATALGVFVGPHMGLQVLLVGSFVAWLFLFAHWLTRRLRLKKNSIVELPMACFFSLSTCLILACAS